MSDIRLCLDHGYYEDTNCPVCGTKGKRVLSHGRRRQLSKFACGLLRHFPDEYDVSLTPQGWTAISDVVEAVTEKYEWADGEDLRAVAAMDGKGRYEIDQGRIRAAYGHSVDVSLESSESPVPDVLYHGTNPDNVDAILSEGLRPMSRQLVHLSDSPDEALEVGRRHDETPVLLRVDTKALLDGGDKITKRGNSVYTAPRIDPKYITVVEDR